MSGRIVITGAGGFVGRALVEHLQRTGREIVPVTRATPEPWAEVLRGADAVVHLAARAHVVHDTATDPISEFRVANVAATERLLSAAIGCSVRRFVFVSSIGVLGNDSGQRAFTAADSPNPIEPYARSKWEAEQRVMTLTAGTATQPVIIRPPLVYGPGVKGNFLRLLKLVDSRVPLPFAGLTAQRSFIGIDNLCGLLAACVDHPAAAGRTLLAGDGEDVTLPALLESIGRGLRRPARLFHAPWGLVESLARLAGRGADLARLSGSLRVDDSVTRHALGWQPGLPFETGIRAMAEWYREAAAS
jgi:nucleoside-diphosphate-sugar epimerase